VIANTVEVSWKEKGIEEVGARASVRRAKIAVNKKNKLSKKTLRKKEVLGRRRPTLCGWESNGLETAFAVGENRWEKRLSQGTLG